MQSLRIAYRNVFRQARRNLLLGGAIAFGFFIFTLLNGFTGGLVGTVSSNLAGVLGGHLYISGSEVSGQGSEVSVVRDTAALEEALSGLGDEVASYTTRSSASASVIFGSSEETAELVGVDFSQEPGFTNSLELEAGSLEAFLETDTGVLLPAELIEDLGLDIGESVIVRTTTVTGQQNVGDFVVVGSLAASDLFGPGGGAQGYTRAPALNALLAMEPGQYQTMNVYVRDLAGLGTTTTALYDALARAAPVEPREDGGGAPNLADFFGGGLSSVDEADRWQGTKFAVTNLNDQLAGVTALVNLITWIGWGVFAVILLVIMVGVTNAYRMVMIERTAEIGTMRAMGMPRAGVRNIFLWEAFLVALGGAVAGLAVAALTMFGVGLIDLGSASGFGFLLDDGHLRFSLSLLSTLLTGLLVTLLSTLAVLWPAQAAARLQPAEALRAG